MRQIIEIKLRDYDRYRITPFRSRNGSSNEHHRPGTTFCVTAKRFPRCQATTAVVTSVFLSLKEITPSSAISDFAQRRNFFSFRPTHPQPRDTSRLFIPPLPYRGRRPRARDRRQKEEGSSAEGESSRLRCYVAPRGKVGRSGVKSHARCLFPATIFPRRRAATAAACRLPGRANANVKRAINDAFRIGGQS